MTEAESSTNRRARRYGANRQKVPQPFLPDIIRSKDTGFRKSLTWSDFGQIFNGPPLLTTGLSAERNAELRNEIFYKNLRKPNHPQLGVRVGTGQTNTNSPQLFPEIIRSRNN